MIDYIINEPKMLGDNQLSYIIGTCLSTDEKPVIGIYYNSMLFEINTQTWYVFDNTKTWKKNSGDGAGEGTTVEANPTLDGTEDDLTGLQIDGVKYKVPSGGSSGVLLVEESNEGILNKTWKELYDAKFSVLIQDYTYNGDPSLSQLYVWQVWSVSQGPDAYPDQIGYWITYSALDGANQKTYKTDSENGYPVYQNEPNEPIVM